MKRKYFVSLFSILISLLILSCRLAQSFAPASTPTPASSVTPSPLPTTTPTATPSPLPAVFLTMFINEYESFTVYRQRDLWESEIGTGDVLVEDFEKDVADYGELTNPYLTGNGFLLEGGSCPAQILEEATLLPTGNLLHFRDFGCGLTFIFPNDSAVSAFGFDYRPSEEWNLIVNDTTVTIPAGRPGFIGVVFHGNYPNTFTLSSEANGQGGLSVDNISYITITVP